jgi:proline dehydrogenase
VTLVRQLSSLVVKQAWLRKVVVTTPGVRDLAWRFVAGEDLDAGLRVIASLNAQGIGGSLNHVGAHVRDRGQAVAAADAAIDSLHAIHARKLDCHLSVKLTQIGLDVDEGLCRTQLRRVLDCAGRLGIFLRIDMEESPYVERTIGLFEEVRRAHGADAVGIVLQSYLRNGRGHLERLVAGGSRIRLVKGGYWERAAVVHRGKADIDAAFRTDMELLLRRGRHPAIATHDERAIERARRIAEEAGLDRQAFEFQMLLGVGEELQERLVREGHPVRCYVPYGRGWYEYVLGCARRLPGGALRRLGGRFRPHRA